MGSQCANPVKLSRREDDVAQLIIQGWSNKEISRQLGIKVTTVEHHIHYIFEKMMSECDCDGRDLRVYLSIVYPMLSV